MADLRTSFVTLEDIATEAGVPLSKALEGDDIADHNAHGALVAKDGDDKFGYLNLDDAGNLLATVAALTTSKKGDGETAAGSATYVTVATVALTASKVYKDLEVLVSSFRDAIFQVVQLNDAAEVVLVSGIRVGAGTFNQFAKLTGLEFTAGATGTQSLLIKGKNLNALSAMSATATIKEVI
jgi:hypothetical protein